MISISLIKTPRPKDVEKLAQITDRSNSDGVVHTFKLRTKTAEFIVFLSPLPFLSL